MGYRRRAGTAMHEPAEKSKIVRHPGGHGERRLREKECLLCGEGPVVPDMHCGCTNPRCECHYCTKCGVKTKFYRSPKREIIKHPFDCH